MARKKEGSKLDEKMEAAANWKESFDRAAERKKGRSYGGINTLALKQPAPYS